MKRYLLLLVSNTPFKGVNIVIDGNKTYKVIK